MSNKWRFIIIGTLLLIGVWGVSAQETDTPDVTVSTFYDWYLEYITGSDEFRNPLVDRAYGDSEYLTQDLIAYIDAQMSTNPGYDLFLCAQDLPQMYQYDVVSMQSGEAVVLMREYFGDYARSHNLTLTLNNSEGTWKIDSVACGDTLTPRGVAQDFYDWYLGLWQQIQDSGTDSNPLIEGLYREYPFLTEEFIETVDTEIATRTLGGGDPLLCAQDIPHGDLVYDVSFDENDATVLVQTFFHGNSAPHNLTVALQFTEGQWRISDIICGANPETIATLLYREYADQMHYNIANNIEMEFFFYPMPHWNSNVSPALLQQLEADNEAEPMADPVLLAQDIPERFIPELIEFSDTTATVKISGAYPSGEDTEAIYPLTTVAMELVEGQWMLTKIASAR